MGAVGLSETAEALNAIELEPLRLPRLPAVRPAEATTPEQVLALAVQSGATIDQMERMMALAERMQLQRVEAEKRDAVKALNKAFASFKSEAVRILKSKQITDGPLKGKFHATLADVVTATTPALSKYGLSIAWKLTKDEKDWMEVTCTLRHEDGHSESVSMGGAPDTGPGRNAIQARGSTKSYLERYTGTAILGLAAEDDDGTGGPVPRKEAPDVDDFIAAGREKAMEGTAVLLEWWGKTLTAKQRNDLGREFQGWRTAAKAADEAGVKK